MVGEIIYIPYSETWKQQNDFSHYLEKPLVEIQAVFLFCLFLCAFGGANLGQSEMLSLHKIQMLDASVQNIFSDSFGCWLSEEIC